MTRHILLTGGGTGGSVTPLLAIAEQLRQHDPALEFLFIGSSAGPEASLCEAAGVPFQAIPAGKWRRYWSWKNLTDIANLYRAWQAARRIVHRWPPDVVVAAGSFVAVPVVWAARRTGSRVLIHQQDVRPGLANRLMAPAADRITVAFEKSLHAFSGRKVLLTGNPARPEMLHGSVVEARKFFQLEPGVPTLLVVGGGTGSQALNVLISGAAFRLVQHWQVIHVVGNRATMPALQNRRYHQYPFLTWEYPHALAAADLVITRAGLGAMTDLAALRKPAIFVPLPGTHQLDNARVIDQLKAGLVVPQAKLTEQHLWEVLENFRRDPTLGRQWGENIGRLDRPEALTKISQEIIRLAAL